MDSKRCAIDPITFAVIKARIDGIIKQMAEVILRTSRNPILNLCKDFTCSILTYEGKLLTMVDSLPIHVLVLDSSLRHVVDCYQNDIHPGDCFINNDPYYGNSHVGDFTMFAPVFDEEKLVCWTAALCHLIDIGAPIPSSLNPVAHDVYEEGLHFPPLRIAQDYKINPGIVRMMRANLRYPDQWYGDFLAQIGAVRKGEEEIHKLCDKYGARTILEFQDEFLDYGDRRMTEEIKKLPPGTWRTECVSEKVAPICPDGILLNVEMSVDPEQALITFDLRKMPDQLPWGMNLSEACSRGACIEGALPSFDTTLPRNDGVFRHFQVLMREGAVAGIPRWPASTSVATANIADEIAHMVFHLFELMVPGRGHAGCGFEGATISALSGVDFRKNNAPYGTMGFLAASGGGASMGCDGWVNMFCVGDGGNMAVSSVELTELEVPQIVWELKIIADSGGAGQWRGAPGTYHRIQPRHHQMTVIPFGIGHTDPPPGEAGGMNGSLIDHWKENHFSHRKTEQFFNVGTFQVNQDEDWVVQANGGGGYGNPLLRDPDSVRDDVRNGIVSFEAARNLYGVVLDTSTELYLVDYGATDELRAHIMEERSERGNGFTNRD